MIETRDILETISMIRQENLDIRTITMGISLLDCVSDDADVLCDRIYDKITTKAEKLVETGNKIEKKYGIPIVNKRVSVTPVSLIGGRIDRDGYIKVAHTLQRAAEQTGINFIGGYSALVHKGMTPGEREMILSIPQALAETQMVCSSVNVATTQAGINMDAIALMGKVIKQAAYLTRDNQSIGCAKLVVFANVPEDNPFMAGAFHGVGEPDTVINVGVSGPGVVSSAIARAGDCDLSTLADVIKKTAFKITRVGQLVASEASCAYPCDRRLGGAYFRGYGSGKHGRARHDGLPCHAQRCGQEGRRYGVLARGRPFGRIHSRVRGCGHDRGGRARCAFDREAGGYDRSLLGWP